MREKGLAKVTQFISDILPQYIKNMIFLHLDNAF